MYFATFFYANCILTAPLFNVESLACSLLKDRLKDIVFGMVIYLLY